MTRCSQLQPKVCLFSACLKCL